MNRDEVLKKSQRYWDKRLPKIVQDMYNLKEKSLQEFIKKNREYLDKLNFELLKAIEKTPYSKIKDLADSEEMMDIIFKCKQELRNMAEREINYLERLLLKDMELTMEETSKALGISFEIDNKELKNLVKKPWVEDGKHFSDRIWTNKEKLSEALNTKFVEGVQKGWSVQHIVKEMRPLLGSTPHHQTEALVRTEYMHFMNVAETNTYAKAGCTQFKIKVAHDERTCQVCGPLDSTVYDINDVGMVPPFHTRCRCFTSPVLSSFKEPLEGVKSREEIVEPLKPLKKSISDMSGKELRNYAKTKLNTIFDSSIDDKALKHWVKWQDDLYNKLPALKNLQYAKDNPLRVSLSTDLSSKHAGYYSVGSNQIVLSSKLFLEGSKEVKKMIELGDRGYNSFYSFSSSHINRTYAHEYGHYVQELMMRASGSKKISTSGYDKYSKELRREALKRLEKLTGYHYTPKDLGRSDILSGYGGTNAAETFAEAFQEIYNYNLYREDGSQFRKMRDIPSIYLELIKEVFK